MHRPKTSRTPSTHLQTLRIGSPLVGACIMAHDLFSQIRWSGPVAAVADAGLRFLRWRLAGLRRRRCVASIYHDVLPVIDSCCG